MARSSVRCKAPAPAELVLSSVAAMKKSAAQSSSTKNKSPATTAAKKQSPISFTRTPRAAATNKRTAAVPSQRSVLDNCRKPARPGKPRIIQPTAKASKAVSGVSGASSVRGVSKASKRISKKQLKLSPVPNASNAPAVINTNARTCLSRVCNAEGIVWAKLCGFPHWPARMISEAERVEEATFRVADDSKRPADDTLVYFFGTRNVAWVPKEKAVRTWKSGMRKKYDEKATRDKKQFRKALTEVRKHCRGKSKQLFLPQ